MPAAFCTAEKIIKDNPYNGCQPYAIVNAQRFSIIKHVPESLRCSLSDIAGIVVSVYNLSNAAAYCHSTERGDERRQLEFSHEKAVHQSNNHAGCESNQ